MQKVVDRINECTEIIAADKRLLST